MPKPRVGGRQYGANAQSAADNVGWCSVEGAKVTLIRRENEIESGDDLIMGTGQMGRTGGSMMNLTKMTLAELTAIKEIIDQAFELAIPVVRQRDEEANAALEQGDDSFDRIYRAVPQLVYRKGAVASYGESLHDRPQDVSDPVGGGDDRA